MSRGRQRCVASRVERGESRGNPCRTSPRGQHKGVRHAGVHGIHPRRLHDVRISSPGRRVMVGGDRRSCRDPQDLPLVEPRSDPTNPAIVPMYRRLSPTVERFWISSSLACTGAVRIRFRRSPAVGSTITTPDDHHLYLLRVYDFDYLTRDTGRRRFLIPCPGTRFTGDSPIMRPDLREWDQHRGHNFSAVVCSR